MANLLYDISLEVQRGLAENGIKLGLPPLVDFEAKPAHAFERRVVAAAQAALGDRTLLFLFDEFKELEARVRSGDLEEMLGLGEAHLAFLWEQATPWERAILAAIAHLVSSGEIGTVETVGTMLAGRG